MAISTYAVVDGAGNIANVILWDGVTTWAPPAGTTAVLSDGTARIGGTYSGGSFFGPGVTPP